MVVTFLTNIFSQIPSSSTKLGTLDRNIAIWCKRRCPHKQGSVDTGPQLIYIDLSLIITHSQSTIFVFNLYPSSSPLATHTKLLSTRAMTDGNGIWYVKMTGKKAIRSYVKAYFDNRYDTCSHIYDKFSIHWDFSLFLGHILPRLASTVVVVCRREILIAKYDWDVIQIICFVCLLCQQRAV